MTEPYLLPHKLSELAQVALNDLALAESLPKQYRIDMGNWLVQKTSGVCVMCAAGAVMSFTLGEALRLGERLDHPTRIAQRFGENARALFAIDMLRRGWVGSALAIINSDEPEKTWWECDDQDDHELTREMGEYESGPDGWRDEMNQLVSDLREAGL